jgi:hypothetical protein
MNKGDKVICIKDFDVSNQKFIKGKVYQIKRIDKYSCYIAGEIYINDRNFGYRLFYFKYERKSWHKMFSEYFITLAEWRDKQINLILDEAI